MKRQKRTKLEAFILQHYGVDTKESSLHEFAEVMDVSIHEVRKWIDGYRAPRPERQRRIEAISKGRITLYDW